MSEIDKIVYTYGYKYSTSDKKRMLKALKNASILDINDIKELDADKLFKIRGIGYKTGNKFISIIDRYCNDNNIDSPFKKLSQDIDKINIINIINRRYDNRLMSDLCIDASELNSLIEIDEHNNICIDGEKIPLESNSIIKFNDRDKDVIIKRLRYKKSITSLAEEYKLSKQRISQIIHQVIFKIKKLVILKSNKYQIRLINEGQLKDILDMSDYLENRCYCPGEIYSPDGLFYMIFKDTDQFIKIGDRFDNEMQILVILSKSSITNSTQILTLFIDDSSNSIIDAERYDATEHNIKEIKNIITGIKNTASFDSYDDYDEKAFKKIIALTQAIMI